MSAHHPDRVTRPHPASAEDRGHSRCRSSHSRRPLGARARALPDPGRAQPARRGVRRPARRCRSPAISCCRCSSHLEAAGDEGVVRFAASVFEIRLLVQARGWERIDGPQVTLACAPARRAHARADRARPRRSRRGAAGSTTSAPRRRRRRCTAPSSSSTSDGDLEPEERADLRALQAVLTGRAASELARTLGLTALPAEPLAATERLAELTSSRADDAASPRRP